MPDVAITAKPTARPTYVSCPIRQTGGSRQMRVTWKNPAAATAGSNKARAEGIGVVWDVELVNASNTKQKLRRNFYQRRADTSLTQFTLDLNSWTPAQFPDEVWTRDKMYPGGSTTKEVASVWLLKLVRVGVYYYNRKGDGPKVITQNTFAKPAKPTISALVQDEAGGNVSCKVTCPKGENMQEAHSAWWTRTVYDSSTKQSAVSHGRVSRGGSASVGWDVSDRMRLKYGQYVRVTVSAVTRGFWGKSDPESRTHYVSYPREPEIRRVETPSKAATGKVTVHVDTKNDREKYPQFPVHGVRLEKLVSCDYKTAAAIPADADWQDMNVVDDGECTALACTVSDVKPLLNKYSYIRIKTWNEHEALFYRYSKPVKLTALETHSPSASNDDMKVLSVKASKDGTALKVTLQYDENNHNTGTIITWSEYYDAWRSTQQPDEFSFTWHGEETEYTRDGQKRWRAQQVVYIRGLKPSTTYWVNARRYLETDDRTTYSAWSGRTEATTAAEPATPGDEEEEVTKVPPAPDSVTLRAPASVARGSALPLTWTFQPATGEDVDEEAAATQTWWQLVCGRPVTSGKRTTVGAPKVITTGYDARGAYDVRAATVLAKVGTATTLTLAVRVKTGGTDWTESDAVTVRVADAPRLACYADPVTAQPATVTLRCSAPSSVAMVLRAAGAAGDFPDHLRDQPEGETVWADVVTPTWTAGAASANLCTNLPANWERGAFYEEDVTDSDTGVVLAHMGDESAVGGAVRLTAGQAVEVTPGTTYRVALTAADAWRVALYAYDGDGACVPTDCVAWAAGPLTWTPTTATTLRLALRREPEGEAWPDELTDAVRVMVTEGTTAQDWAPRDGDVPSLTAEVTLPESLDLWDGASYELTATATDATTGLVSDAAECGLSVAWAHQAVPADGCTLEVSDVTDADGIRSISASLTIAAPDGAVGTDRYDVYRVTPDGAQLVASDAVDGSVVVDPYAPYGGEGLAYRVATRTADGDVAWADYPYTLAVNVARIDYMGDHGMAYVELPYNLELSDGYAKDFEAREKLDGSTDGYWNPAVRRSGSVRSDLILVEDAASAAALRELGRRPAACLVRTPVGCCYAANVDVTDLGASHSNAAESVALSTREVGMPADFLATVTEGV